MQWLRAADPDFEESFARVVAHRRESDVDVGRDVAAILADVRERGDAALADYTRRFDGFDLGEDWRISVQDCRAAYDSLEPELRNALDLAAERIRAYHEQQLPEDRDYTDAIGMRLGARWRPVEAAGLYVPGGRAAYPSSLLMNAIPARVAGSNGWPSSRRPRMARSIRWCLPPRISAGSRKSGAWAARRPSPLSPMAPSGSPGSM